MFIVSPSIYSADLLRLADVLDSVSTIENLHIDIDDGNFVRGISFGTDMVRAIASHTTIPLDVHLEVLNPCDYVDALCQTGIRRLCAHIEALPYPSLFLSDVKRRSVKAGLSLNLKTPVQVLQPYANDVDHVLLVSVEADHEGLHFRPGVLEKIAEARRLLPKETTIWVDGGINDTNLRDVVLAGADAVVIGRAVFDKPAPAAAWKYYRDRGEAYRLER